jgi:hypothetical protein
MPVLTKHEKLGDIMGAGIFACWRTDSSQDKSGHARIAFD